jgi:hypothetical protein
MLHIPNLPFWYFSSYNSTERHSRDITHVPLLFNDISPLKVPKAEGEAIAPTYLSHYRLGKYIRHVHGHIHIADISGCFANLKYVHN